MGSGLGSGHIPAFRAAELGAGIDFKLTPKPRGGAHWSPRPPVGTSTSALFPCMGMVGSLGDEPSPWVLLGHPSPELLEGRFNPGVSGWMQQGGLCSVLPTAPCPTTPLGAARGHAERFTISLPPEATIKTILKENKHLPSKCLSSLFLACSLQLRSSSWAESAQRQHCPSAPLGTAHPRGWMVVGPWECSREVLGVPWVLRPTAGTELCWISSSHPHWCRQILKR